MLQDTVEQIREAESKAISIRKNAQIEAERIVSGAEERARELLKKSQTASKEYRETQLKSAQVDAQNNYEKEMKKAEKDATEYYDDRMKNVDAILGKIIGRIVGGDC